MKTIYVITEGNYSDYHIVGVFDDIGKAKKYVEKKNLQDRYNSLQIEEYPLNKIVNQNII